MGPGYRCRSLSRESRHGSALRRFADPRLCKTQAGDRGGNLSASHGVYHTKENTMQKHKLVPLILGVALLISACASKPSVEPTKIPPTKAAEKFVDVKTLSIKDVPSPGCPVTLPADPAFEAPEPYFATAPWPGFFWFGSEHLWTALQTNGVWEDLPKNPDGYTQKIMWWSSHYVLKD